MACGFSLDKVATPAKTRPPPPLPLIERNNKIPKVENMVAVQQGPRPPVARKLPETNDVIVCLYKYTDDARRVWEDVKEPGLPLWQVFLGGGYCDVSWRTLPAKGFLLNRPTAFPKKCHSPKVQIAHEARDSICVNAVDRFNEFLSQHPEAPDSTVELQRQALIKLGKPSFFR